MGCAPALSFTPPKGPLRKAEGAVFAVPIAWLNSASGGARILSKAKRLIRQGGVSLDGQVVRDEQLSVRLDRERLLKVGKRFFRRIKKGGSPRKSA